MFRSLEDNQQLHISEIRVSNLCLDALHDLVVDVYGNGYNAKLLEEDVQSIVPFVNSMTKGNAFHSILILRSLIEEGVLFNSEIGPSFRPRGLGIEQPQAQQGRASSTGSKSTASTETATTSTTINTTITDDGTILDNIVNEESNKIAENDYKISNSGGISDAVVVPAIALLTLDKAKFNRVLLHNQVDMVELLCQGLSKLDNETQKVLQIAACLGAEFDSSLVIIDDDETSSIATALSFAMELGLIREKKSSNVRDDFVRSGAPPDDTVDSTPCIYTFTHDKIQQACYALIPSNERPQFHLLIGRTIFAAFSTNRQWVNHAMAIANQVQLGIELIAEEQDKLCAVYVFEVAARNAFEKSSFTTSRSYLKAARSLLPRRHWRDCYERSLAIFELEVEVLCAIGQYDEIDSIVDEIVANARSMNDKASAYTIQIYSLGCRSRLSDALDLGFAVLKELGEPFPKLVGTPRIVFSLLSTMRLMKGFTDEQILTVKVMEDPMKLAAMRILNLLQTYAFISKPSHVPLIVTRIVQLTLRHGQSAMSAPGFAFYGFLISSALQDLNVAVRSGNLALAFQERYQCQEWIPRVFACVYGMIKTLVEPLRNCIVPLTYAFRTGLDAGDAEVSNFTASVVH